MNPINTVRDFFIVMGIVASVVLSVGKLLQTDGEQEHVVFLKADDTITLERLVNDKLKDAQCVQDVEYFVAADGQNFVAALHFRCD